MAGLITSLITALRIVYIRLNPRKYIVFEGILTLETDAVS